MNRKERRAARLPPYTRKLLEALETVQLPSGLHVARICHDDWCALLAGKGPCNCDPDIHLPILPGKN